MDALVDFLVSLRPEGQLPAGAHDASLAPVDAVEDNEESGGEVTTTTRP
jgi:hypothetical protein